MLAQTEDYLLKIEYGGENRGDEWTSILVKNSVSSIELRRLAIWGYLSCI